MRAPRRRLPPVVAMLLLAVTLTGFAATPAQAEHVEVNDSTFPHGACERVCIPAIVVPRFTSDPGEAGVAADDQVVGFTHNGQARAYPIDILVWHEIVNDVVGGDPVAVTYCPLCGSSLVYDRDVDGRILTFQTSGRLHQNDLVMLDDETRSLWPQLMGEAVSGPLHGTRLITRTSTLTSWGDWQRAHPGSDVLDRPLCSDWPYAVNGCPTASKTFARTYGDSPYGDYDTSRRIGISGHESRDIQGLHPKAQVVGVELEGVAKAWETRSVAAEGVITDDVAGLPVVVTFDGSGVRVFHRQVTQRFTADAEDATRMTDQDGVAWDRATGTPVSGQAPDADASHPTGPARLAQVPSVTSFWFAWVDFHPGTLLYGSARVVGTEPDGTGRLDGSTPLTLRFSHAMDRDSVEQGLRLEPAHEVTPSWPDDRTLVLTPLEPWPPGGREVKVTVEGAQAQGGLPLASTSESFRTAGGGLAAGFEDPGIAPGLGILFGAGLGLALVRRIRRDGFRRRS